MFPKRRILDPKPRRVEGPKSATEWSHEGEASVAAAICRFPARDLPFATMIVGIFYGKLKMRNLRKGIHLGIHRIRPQAQRLSSPAAMECGGIAMRCSALFK